MEFVADAVATVHVAGHTGNVKGFATAVALDQANHLRCHFPLIHQPADAQHRLQTKGDFGLHVGEFPLNELVGG